MESYDKPSMWCNECKIWTKDYLSNGNHSCGEEVKSSSVDSGFPVDTDYEGISTFVFE